MKNRRNITPEEVAAFRAERAGWNDVPDPIVIPSLEFSAWLMGYRFRPIMDELLTALERIGRRFRA